MEKVSEGDDGEGGEGDLEKVNVCASVGCVW